MTRYITTRVKTAFTAARRRAGLFTNSDLVLISQQLLDQENEILRLRAQYAQMINTLETALAGRFGNPKDPQ